MWLVDEQGNRLDGEFDVEFADAGIDIVLHSRSGSNKSGQERNAEYFAVLERLLQSLASVDAKIDTIAVDSRQAQHLPMNERLIDLDYPLRLSPSMDAHRLRVQITEGQRTVASSVLSGRGGNKHKRIRISVDLRDTGVEPSEIPLLLGAEVHTPSGFLGRRYSEARADPTVSPADVFTFDPSSRERALTGHARIQNALADFVRSMDCTPRSPATHEPDFDLAWSIGATAIVAEVKTLSGTNPVGQLRLGLGQVLHYRWALSELYGSCVAVLAVETRPPLPWVAICEHAGVTVTWPPHWPQLESLVSDPEA